MTGGGSSGGRNVGRVSLLFFAIYFVQGFGEPGEGLIAQPLRSMLKAWGKDSAQTGAFFAALALPWSIKPLYGLLCDFVPFMGQRRRSYLIAATTASSLGMAYVYFRPPAPGALLPLLLVLMLPAVGIAFCDVVADALMVESGQATGLAGRLQAVQWGAMYVATIGTGSLGGFLTERHQESLAFLICAALLGVTLLLAWVAVREPLADRPAIGFRQALRMLLDSARLPVVATLVAFLLLWNFNPFTSTVLYLYMTQALGISEQAYGNTVSVSAVASVAAAVAYAIYCRRFRPMQLAHWTTLLGVLSTLAFLLLEDLRSALWVSALFGFSSMTATLMQFDLAARFCPPAVAGTIFALLMSVCNLANALGMWLGGEFYDAWAPHWGRPASYRVLIAIGALTTAACWSLIPRLKRTALQAAGPPR